MLKQMRLVLYAVGQMLTFGYLGRSRLGARLADPGALEALQWAKRNKGRLGEEMIQIDHETKKLGEHQYYRSMTPFRHISFWEEDGELKGGLYDDQARLQGLLPTPVKCPYINERAQPLFEELAGEAKTPDERLRDTSNQPLRPTMIKRSEVESWLQYHENMLGSIQETVEEEDLSFSKLIRAEQHMHRHRQHVEMLSGLLGRMEEGECATPTTG